MISVLIKLSDLRHCITCTQLSCSYDILFMVLLGLASCQWIKINQTQFTFSSNFAEGVLFQHLKTKIYVNMRAKDPELETPQRNRLNDQSNLTSSLPLPFTFEALLCKFKYKCLFIMNIWGNQMKSSAQVSCYIRSISFFQTSFSTYLTPHSKHRNQNLLIF